MDWRHGTWQCSRCGFKLGCCEGEPQTACDVPAASVPSRGRRRRSPRPEAYLQDEHGRRPATPLEVEAVRGICFEVGQGELFGLLGPNGAGKTTTIKMLITLLLPTSRRGAGARPRRRPAGAGGAAADRLRLRRRPRPLRAAVRVRQPALLRGALRRHRPAASGGGSARCSSSSASPAASRSGSRATRAACASGCTSRAGSSTTRRSSSSTSRRSASTRSARASCARRSPGSCRPGRRCSSRRTTCSRPTRSATGSP